MSPRTLRLLAVAVVVLFAAVWLVNRQRDAGPAPSALLLPGLEDRLDEITAITLTDEDGSTRIERRDNAWVVPAKGGYRADTAKLRGLLVGLAEAKKIEQKTANPELYGRIGVLDPTKAGEQQAADEPEKSGVLVASEGLGDADFAVILGDSAQRDYRYVRVADESTSWLVDRNPDVPDAATGWLVRDITDLAASRVQLVTIRHADGETIRVAKDSEDADNYTVEDIPEGRELSYASVANSIAAALDNLKLDDVRPASKAATETTPDASDASSDEADATSDSEGDSNDTPEAVTTVFRTFDGLELTVDSTGTDAETWIRVHAAALPREEDTAAEAAPAATGNAASDTAVTAGAAGEQGTPAADAAPDGSAPKSTAAEAGEEAAANGGPKDGEASADAAGDAAEKDAAEKPDPEAEAARINARVGGWEYRIPQYKASQLRRHWEDLLSAPADDEEE
ncbi:MAG TPA: DUF4340 domain-containing protein [Woeseiaceae bacterium]